MTGFDFNDFLYAFAALLKGTLYAAATTAVFWVLFYPERLGANLGIVLHGFLAGLGAK